MFFHSKFAKSFALATTALLMPVAAHAEEFVDKDGVSYTYTTSVQQGRTIMTGMADGRVPFRLVVRGQRVTGQYNGKRVEFTLREVERNAEALAMR